MVLLFTITTNQLHLGNPSAMGRALNIPYTDIFLKGPTEVLETIRAGKNFIDYSITPLDLQIRR